MSCFLGIKTQTALSTLVEVGDFKRFASAQQFASYLGLTPGEDSSGEEQKRLGITKAGNSHVRTLLVEAAQGYTRGQIGYKRKIKGCKTRKESTGEPLEGLQPHSRFEPSTTELCRHRKPCDPLN